MGSSRGVVELWSNDQEISKTGFSVERFLAVETRLEE